VPSAHRGQKATLYEGGERVIALVGGGWTSQSTTTLPAGRSSLVHVVDWLPTFLQAAGVDAGKVANLTLDGMPQLDTILRGMFHCLRAAK